jgi:hypothetical protein
MGQRQRRGAEWRRGGMEVGGTLWAGQPPGRAAAARLLQHPAIDPHTIHPSIHPPRPSQIPG